MMEGRASSAKQTTISTRGRTADRAGIDTNDRNAGFQELIDARETAPAESNDAGIGVYLASERRIRRAAVSIPDGRSRTQK